LSPPFDAIALLGRHGDRAATIALLVVPEALPSIGFCALPAAEAMAVLARLPARFRLPASSVWAG